MFTEKTMTIIAKKSKTILAVVVFMVSFFALSAGNASAGLECPAGFGDCDCDGTCETDVLIDPNNCGRCGIVCASGNCTNGFCDAVVPVLGGLVPCGRDFDDDTTLWNEKEECKLCHFVILADNVIDYLLGIVGLVAVLSLVVGGMLYITSSGNSNLVTTAKTAFRKSLYGFVVVFIAWVATNTTMVLFGFDDPLGDGSWKMFDCNLETAAPIINYYCGDGVVTSPNDDGIMEVCDPMERKSVFISRKTASHGNCVNGDGNCPPDCFTAIDNDCVNVTSAAAWARTIYSCSAGSCDFGCAGDPLADEIGGGCYQPILADGSIGDACQKGRYVCDFSTNTVVCQNTYNDPAYKLAGDYCADVYDECCVDAGSALATMSFNKVRIPAMPLCANTYCTWGVSCNFSGCSNSITCDEVCKNNGGEICIGVGLMNSTTFQCVYIVHNLGNITCSDGSSNHDCGDPGNLTTINCRDRLFGRTSPTCIECYDSDGDGSTEGYTFNVGEAVCYCK